MEVVACLLLPLSRRGRDAPHPSDRARFALGREPHRRELPARQLLLHRVERPDPEGHARVERAAAFRGHPRGVPVREGPERRLAQARTAAPALRPAEQEQESVISPARTLSGVVLAVVAASAAPDSARAQVRLTRDEVLAALAGASPAHPADFTGKDRSGLDLAGVDFKRANLTKARLVRTNLARAQLNSATLTDAVATEADFTAANLDVAVAYGADLRQATLPDASIFAVILYGADLSDADLSGARLIGPMNNAKAQRAKFIKANLGVDPGNQSMGIMRVDATAVDFSGADFTGANLFKALLVRADFTGADLTDADVEGADLAGAIFNGFRVLQRMLGLNKASHFDQAIFNDWPRHPLD